MKVEGSRLKWGREESLLFGWDGELGFSGSAGMCGIPRRFCKFWWDELGKVEFFFWRDSLPKPGMTKVQRTCRPGEMTKEFPRAKSEGKQSTFW